LSPAVAIDLEGADSNAAPDRRRSSADARTLAVAGGAGISVSGATGAGTSGSCPTGGAGLSGSVDNGGFGIGPNEGSAISACARPASGCTDPWRAPAGRDAMCP
jgi:hypothetical protein